MQIEKPDNPNSLSVFPFINPMLHSVLRLKIMVTLDSIENAEFMHLCKMTEATRGNMSIQLTTLQSAGYINITKVGEGYAQRTISHITPKGREALHSYMDALNKLFTMEIPSQEKIKLAK